MSILKDLYYGNIEPSQRFIKKDSEYKKIQGEFVDCLEELNATLTEEQKRLRVQIEDKSLAMCCISEEERFIDGFCMGAKMMLEIINFKSSNYV